MYENTHQLMLHSRGFGLGERDKRCGGGEAVRQCSTRARVSRRVEGGGGVGGAN